MISRRLLLLDRTATLLLAVLLIAVGALGAWWWTDPGWLPARSDTGPAARVVAMHWFPWASAAAGVFLIYLGIRWWASHLSRSNVTDLRLAGSAPEGTLVVQARSVADAAAAAFADTLGVRAVSGNITRDRGQLVAKISSTIDPQVDLTTVASRADEVAAQLHDVLGRDDVRCRVELRVARTARRQPRTT